MPGADVGLEQADPLASQLAAFDARIAALEKTGPLPPGFIGWTAMAVAPPGWLIADGSAFDVDRYAALAVACPTGFLPNLIDCFPVGAGNLYTLLANGGAASVTLTGAQSGQPAIAAGVTGSTTPANTGVDTPDHTHQYNTPASIAQGTPGGGAINAGAISGGPLNTSGRSVNHTHTSAAHTHTTPAVAAANATQAHSVLNPYCALTPLVHV